MELVTTRPRAVRLEQSSAAHSSLRRRMRVCGRAALAWLIVLAAAAALARTADASLLRPNAAIVYLVTDKERYLAELVDSLALLDEHFLSEYPYPVLILYDKRLPEAYDEFLRHVVSNGSLLSFVPIDTASPPVDPATVGCAWPCYCAKGLEYRYMCRFQAWRLHELLEQLGFDLYWRLDSDGYVTRRVGYDVFRIMEERDLAYAFVLHAWEVPACATGLWELTKAFAAEHGMPLDFPPEYRRPNPADPGLGWQWNMLLLYTNFEIGRVAAFRSPLMRAFAARVEAAGGVFRHRWGDAPIRTLAVLLLEPARVAKLADIAYAHQDESAPQPTPPPRPWYIPPDLDA